MDIEEFVGRAVTLYLEGGHVISGKVLDIKILSSTGIAGRLEMEDMLALAVNKHATFVRFSKIIAVEIIN